MTGLNVKATTVEMMTETAMVMVNCRNSCPVMPLRKLTGTNTAHKTKDMAIKALLRPFMAFFVAS